MQVIHNIHIFKKYFPYLDTLALESNIRIDERTLAREQKKAERN
jgi:hypothetical protein